MIVQACINGARPAGYHPALPLTIAAMVADSAACVAAGAAEIHMHPRGPDGRESLAAVDETVAAVRRACPGTLLGVSTGDWIEGDAARTRERIAAWKHLPDHASVNLADQDAPAVMALLDRLGVGIEAGLATVADAERLVSIPDHRRVLRVLIEIEEQNLKAANAAADRIAEILARAEVRRPILLHGCETTVWPFVERARDRRWSTRVGLEDGCHLSNGDIASGNAALVSDAVAAVRG